MSFDLGSAFVKVIPAFDRQAMLAAGSQAGDAVGRSFSESFNEAGKRLIKGFIGAELVLKTVELLKDAVKAARDDELATAQLTTAIRANAQARADDTDRIEAQVRAAQQLGFTDDQVKQSLTALVIATHDLGSAIDLQNLAMDLARAKHKSLQEASQELVAVEAGRYRGLAQLGIQIDSHATKEEALAAIQARVAGQREAFANTDAGAAAKRDAAYEHLLETVGQKLVPILTDLANFETNTLIPAATAVAENLDRFAPILEGLALALSVKVVGGFAAAKLGALGFGEGLTVVGGEAATQGALIEGAANSSAVAWRRALGVILILPEVVHLVGDAYDSVTKAIFGNNAAQDYYQRVTAKSAGATGEQAAAADAAGASTDQMTGSTDKLAAATVAGARASKSSIPPMQESRKAMEAAGVAASNTGISYDEYVAATRRAHSFSPSIVFALKTQEIALDNVGAAALWAAQQYAEVTRAAGLQDRLGNPGKVTTDRHGTPIILPKPKPKAKPPVPHPTGGGAPAESQAEKDAANALARSLDNLGFVGAQAIDKIHKKNLETIDSTLRLAREAHTAAIQRINDTLDTQRAEHAAPVTAAEQQQQAIEDARRLRDLHETLQEAALSGDQRPIRDAQEALQSYQAQQNIARLRGAQATADQASELAARQATATADATLTAAETAAEKAKVKEDARYADQKRRFDVAMQVLKDDAKISGADIAHALAAGMLSKVGEVEAAAKALAKAAAKSLPHSPAEIGPFHDAPAYDRGKSVAEDFAQGINDWLAKMQITGVASVARQLNAYASPSPAAAAARALPVGGGSQAGGVTVQNTVLIDHGPTFERIFGGDRLVRYVDQRMAELPDR